MRRPLALLALCLLPVSPRAWAAEPPKPPAMKFNEVKEVAPGVFFRYSSISPTDPSVFGGCNNIWVVFEDYVVVIDANFPKEAEDVLAAVRKTTPKPVRYVLDTHHHGDHSWGNAIWVKAGATIVSTPFCAHTLRTAGPAEFATAGKPPTGRKDVAASTLKVPTLVFEDKLVLDDGKQRVEFLHFGHSHTAGDAVAWLPRHGLLCTGDACVNGAYNYMGQSDSASWVRCLEKMQALPVKMVCPGHGPLAGKELLGRQKRYFIELRQAVRAGIDSGKDVEDIIKGFKPAWYRELTGVAPDPLNVRHVYDELTGRITPGELADDFDVLEGPTPLKESPGWSAPKRIVVPAGLMPDQLAELKRIAPKVEFVPAKDAEEAAREATRAEAVLGFASPDIVRAGKTLKWVQAGPEGASKELLEAAHSGKVVLTTTQRAAAPQVADQTFALLLSLTKGTPLRGKTLLVVGLGSTGKQIARRGAAFGMRVTAVAEGAVEKPASVERLEPLEKLPELLPSADVVALALPLREGRKGLVGAEELKRMKKGAILINAAHTPLVDLAALAEALASKHLAGAGLDTSDVGALPEGHALNKVKGVVLTSSAGKPSAEARQRQWQLWRENVRRFVAGEALLGLAGK